ncbi:TonB-dependent receptor [Pedobacter chinensis]|uniref:TonB-dependent receptor n=1 Tax=Pedobacter chinensis TaxID=2282421 RepID=A0A369PQ78_9SPHI|nr:TonB-dependent receptor [Pedobacter chinensis]RDC54693.1 TonB-dependent receptor [Pedobacter chinensis]
MNRLYLTCMLLLAVLTVQAQTRKLSGTIVESGTNTSIPGASISVQGTNLTTVTDANGKFTIEVSNERPITLVIRYVGYADQSIIVQPNEQNISVKLTAQSNVLDEVVVVGFGTIKRRDLTGAVASVKAADIVRAPTHNAIEAIQGRAAGVDITRSSGNAGAGINIQIRGTRSISNNPSPLYVIDGVQNGGSINNINPNDIETIDVLQDASSTAIYGSQGANGVVIITTKKGSSGKARVSYNGYYGINGETAFPNPRQGEDYLTLRRESFRNDAGVITQTDAQIFNGAGELAAIQAGAFVNWVDLAIRNGRQQSHTVSVRGGSETTKALFSLGYFNEEGALKNNDYNRYNFRYNIDHKVNDWFKAGITGQLAYSKTNTRRDPLSTALTAIPLGTPYAEDGSINIFPMLGFAAGNTTLSPLTDERPGAAIDETLATEVNATGYAELTPIKGLTYRMNFGTVLSNSRRGIFNDQFSTAQNNVRYASASITNNNGRYYNWDNVITYTKTVAKHNVTATVLSSYIHSDADVNTSTGIRQVLASQGFNNLFGTEASSRVTTSGFTRYDLLAFAGRLNYSYAGKYLLQATQRWDGASVLAPGRKWDDFASASVGWLISEEEFMKSIKQINNLKLRVSYGSAGNSGSVSPYGSQSLISTVPMGFGEVPAPAYGFSGVVANPDLGWERSTTLNTGLDFGLFNNRVSGNIEVYRTKTTDIILSRSLPLSTGQTTITQNIGATLNTGINASLTTINFQTKDFTWSTTATFSRNREKITALIDGRDIIASSNPEENSLFIGSQVKVFYTYRKLGIWQLDENPGLVSQAGQAFRFGDIKLQDVNGDNIIDAANDRQIIGNVQPKWFGGLQNNFRYKNFDLSIFLIARYGQTVKAEFVGRYNPGGVANGPDNFDYWTFNNPSNDFPRPRQGNGIANVYPNQYQSLLYIDGSFFKVKNIQLGYTLPKSITDKLKIGSLRAYATGSNIYTYSKNKLLRDYDPERGGAESSPLSRQFVFGFNLDL